MEYLLKKIINEFEQNGLLKENLIFESYAANDDKIANYCYYLKDGSFHELNVINNNICYFKEMTITELLDNNPFYVNHRFFTKLDPISEDEFQCEDLVTFSILNTKSYHDLTKAITQN